MVNVTDLAVKLVGDKEIKFRRGRCSAHLYQLELLGSPKKGYYIYRCKRPNCHHFVTPDTVEGWKAQCRECGDLFMVTFKLHVLKSGTLIDSYTFADLCHEYLTCGCDRIEEAKPIVKKEDLSWLNEE